MRDTLGRERQLNNLIDEVADLQRQVRRLQERILANEASSSELLVRDRPDGALWRIYLDVHDPGIMQVVVEAVEGI